MKITYFTILYYIKNLSLDYLYILQKSFEDDFGVALFASAISLFCLMITLFLSIKLIFLVRNNIKRIKNKSNVVYMNDSEKTMIILIFALLTVTSILACIMYLPQMSNIKFKKENSDKIYGMFYKNKIKNYKDNPHLTINNLKFGVINYEQWINMGQYQKLEKEISKKYPDVNVEDFLYKANVSFTLNKTFLNCFNKNFLKQKNSMTIEEMKKQIQLNEEKCLKETTEQFTLKIDSFNKK